jgi:hypothetical protein
MKYFLTRSCQCGKKDQIELTKRQAAFDLYDSKKIWNAECIRCGNRNCVSLGVDKPDIDKELLLEWSTNPELFFLEQDEDLLLADGESLDLLLDMIDNYEILPDKRDILIEALCVIVYDNSGEMVDDLPSSEREVRENLADKVSKELTKRSNYVMEAQTAIRDYIMEVVFPKLNMKSKL